MSIEAGIRTPWCPPLGIGLPLSATLPNFGVTMGLCLAEAGSPGSSLEIRPNRLRHETKEKARKRGPRNETGGKERERERA